MKTDFSSLSDDEFEQMASAQANLAAVAPTPLPPTTLSQPALSGMTDDQFEAMVSGQDAGPPVVEPEPPADLLSQIAAVDEQRAAEDAALQAEYGGAGSQALAGLEGFGRGATLGLSDVLGETASGLAASLGGPDVDRVSAPGIAAPLSDESVFSQAYDQARADIQARRAANPVTSGVSEVAGAIAPALLSGGGSALAKVAGAAPANLVNRAGMAVGSKLAGAAPGILRAGAAGLAGGAVEGGLAAGALAASEVAPEIIQDPGLAAEHILTATSEGALVGGLFGGILGSGSRALTRGADKLDEVARSLAAKVDDVTPQPVAPQTLDDFDVNLQAVEQRPASTTADELMMQDTRGKYAKIVEQQQAFDGKFDDAVQAETRAIRAEMDDVLRGANKVDEYAGIAAKRRANEAAAAELTDMPSGMFDEVDEFGPVRQASPDSSDLDSMVSAAEQEERAALSALEAEKAKGPGPFNSGVVRQKSKGNQWFHIPAEDAPKGASIQDSLARARVSLDEYPDLVTVKLINARRGGLGKGYGSRVYAEIADFAEENGRKMASDATPDRSEFANAWWGKRVKEGVAEFDEARDRFVLTGRLRQQKPIASTAGAETRVAAAKSAADSLRAQRQAALESSVEQRSIVNKRRIELTERHAKARGVVSAIMDEIAEARAGLSDAESKGMGQLQKHIQQKASQIESAFIRGDLGEAYNLLDQGLKGGLGRMRQNLSGSNQDLVERLYPSIQGFLEDESVWGTLAQRQKAVNPHWANRIANSQDASWKQFTSVAGERGANEWDNLALSSDQAIKGLLSNVGDAGAARAEEVFRKNLRAMARDAVERAKAWGGKELQQQAQDMVAKVTKVEQRLDLVARLRQDALEGARAAQQSSTADLAASAVGMVSPRLAFAVQGSAMAKRKVVAAAAEAGKDVGAKVAKHAAKLVKLANRGIDKAARMAPRAAAVALAAVEGGGVQQLVSQKQVDKSIQNAQALLDPMSPESRDLIETAAAVERDEPDLAESMVSLQLRRAQLIQSMLPQQMPGLFAPPPQMDPMRGRKLQRTVSAAYYPERTLRRLADGSATKEEIDAIKALYPGMYQQFVAAVESELGSTRKVPSRDDQQRIHAMTGLTVRPSMEPSAIMKQQQVAMAATAEQEAKEAAARAPGAQARVDPDRLLSRTDRILAQ